MYIKIILLLYLAVHVKSKPSVFTSKCGYETCQSGKPGVLNVHLVPHSHDDVGWLKTVDQYFYGTRNEIQHAGVKTIIDSVIEELPRDPNRRFIWVETAFLWQWWTNEKDSKKHDLVRKLVQTGQLEITGGGWSMNDEAVTHYQSTIDQFTWGFRKLDDMFGSCGRPRIGWQIDAFGHSQETAALMAQMGFDGLFFARLDYRDRAARKKTKETEFMWQPSKNLDESSWLFTSLLNDHYDAPKGFCFDIHCHDENIIDDKNNEQYNLDNKIHQFVEHAKSQARVYKTNNIMLTMGEDFTYMDAQVWYTNLDKIIQHVNSKTDINVFYSTPACYVKALHDANITWTTKQDDFFPYASDEHSYWTGYYTSRPTLKYFERQGNNFLQVCKQIHSLNINSMDQWEELNSLRESMGIMQHHDAITGTEKQHVAEDYALRLNRGISECHDALNVELNKLMAKSETSPSVNMEPCLLLNVSQCATSEKSKSFVVTVYNPLAQVNSHFVRLPVPQSSYKVFDPTGVELTVQLVPIPQAVLDIPGRESKATQELVFKASDLPPLGYKAYYVQRSEGSVDVVQPVTGDDRWKIGNEYISAQIDQISNLIISVKKGLDETNLTQRFEYYEGMEGFNWGPRFRASGAYIFRPKQQETKLFEHNITSNTFKGPLVHEIHQVITDWISQVIRIYEGETHIEFEWQVGPIPNDDRNGREIISRFSTGWATNGVFYTDSNGRETIERKRNLRASWEVDMQEPVAANYYPITTHIAIKTEDRELAVLPDRAQGGSSLKDGDIELMVHRRLMYDDSFGVGEALNEHAFGQGLVARGRHIVTWGSDSGPVNSQIRKLSLSHMVLPPWLLFASTNLTYEEWQQDYVTEFSGLQKSLPENVHLLTLEPWKENSLLIRVEYVFEKTDDSELFKPIKKVTLKDLFAGFKIISAQETTLGANQNIDENSRLVWTVDNDNIKNKSTRHGDEVPKSSNDYLVTLKPMQIRSFIINVTPSPLLKNRLQDLPKPLVHDIHTHN